VSESLDADVRWDQTNEIVYINTPTDVDIAETSHIQLIVNGEVIESDVAPQLVNNRTLVPLRVISEAVVADVNWDQQSRTVTINAGSGTATAPEGSQLIPNKYDEEFILYDDELFIFVENFKLFETEGVKERVITDALNAQFP